MRESWPSDPKDRNKARRSFLTTSIQQCAECHKRENIKIRNKEIKLSLFTDYMVAYVTHSEESTKISWN